MIFIKTESLENILEPLTHILVEDIVQQIIEFAHTQQVLPCLWKP